MIWRPGCGPGISGAGGIALADLGAACPGGAVTPWWLSGGIAAANCWAAYQPKGAASLAASYSNLNSPGTNDCGPGAAPPWDAVNGWKFDGSTYLVTTFVPDSDQSQSVLIQYAGYVDQITCLFGQYDAADRSLRFVSVGPQIYAANGGYYLNLTVFTAAGNHGIAGNQYYKDGLAVGTPIPAWGGAAVLPCWIAALNGLGGFLMTVNIQALAIYSTTVTAAQMLAVATAMAAL